MLMLAAESADVPAGFREQVRQVAPLREGDPRAHALARLLAALFHCYEAQGKRQRRTRSRGRPGCAIYRTPSAHASKTS